MAQLLRSVMDGKVLTVILYSQAKSRVVVNDQMSEAFKMLVSGRVKTYRRCKKH